MGVVVKNRVTQNGTLALVNGFQGRFNLRSNLLWFNFDPYPAEGCRRGR